MAEKLVIYLKDIDSTDADWVFCNHNGEISTPVSSGTITELAEKNKNNIISAQNITCIIKAELLHFSYQNIPAKNKQKALQAIPFVLEEQLAEDIESLHFASNYTTNNTYSVAAIKHETLEKIIESFAALNIKLDFIFPDICCLPQTNSSWNLFNDNDNISIDQHTNTIIHSDKESLALIVAALLKQTNDAQLPESVSIWSNTDVNVPDNIPDSLEIIKHDYDNSALSIFSKNLNSPSLVNLLQGSYKVVSQSQQWWQPWRLAAILAAVALTLELVSGGIALNRLQTENQQLEKAATNIYKKSFPHSKRIVNARVQMENKLKKLRKGNNKGELTFTDLLITMSPIIQQSSAIEIQSINYNNKKIELKISTNKLSSVETLKSRLNSLQNIKAELISSSSESKFVSAKIRIEAI